MLLRGAAAPGKQPHCHGASLALHPWGMDVPGRVGLDDRSSFSKEQSVLAQLYGGELPSWRCSELWVWGGGLQVGPWILEAFSKSVLR